MKVLAARLADVLVADPHPLVLLGREHHLFDQAPVARLDIGPVAEQGAVLGKPLSQLVADPLELRQAQQPRTAV
jgi:hypothetical protein